MARNLILTLGCLIFLLSVGSAGAVTEMDLFKGQRFEGGPWKIRADTVTYDAANHLYTASQAGWKSARETAASTPNR